jgi:hypothetical protein
MTELFLGLDALAYYPERFPSGKINTPPGKRITPPFSPQLLLLKCAAVLVIRPSHQSLVRMASRRSLSCLRVKPYTLSSKV